MNPNHDPQRTRLSLLDAATDLLFAHGYAHLSEPRLCQHVGLTRGALRHHFADGKYDLLPALLDHLFETTLSAVLAGSGSDARARFKVMLEYLRQQPERNLLVLIMELWIGSRTDARLAAALEPRFRHWLPTFFSLAPGATLSPDLLKMRFTLHGAILYVYANGTRPAPLDDTLRALIAEA